METPHTRTHRGLILAVAAVSLAAIWEWHTISQQRDRISTLESAALAASATLGAKSIQAPSMDLQRDCAEAARKWWAVSGWKPTDIAGYENHYNTRLNRCFADFQSTTTAKGSVLTDRQIVDVLENKSYAEFMTYNPGDKKYWEVKPTKCEARVNGELVKCSEEAGFDQLVRAYMEG